MQKFSPLLSKSGMMKHGSREEPVQVIKEMKENLMSAARNFPNDD
ncbi:16585_t:CDS:1, partial [Acaulospora colombiana]